VVTRGTRKKVDSTGFGLGCLQERVEIP